MKKLLLYFICLSSPLLTLLAKYETIGTSLWVKPPHSIKFAHSFIGSGSFVKIIEGSLEQSPYLWFPKGLSTPERNALLIKYAKSEGLRPPPTGSINELEMYDIIKTVFKNDFADIQTDKEKVGWFQQKAMKMLIDHQGARTIEEGDGDNGIQSRKTRKVNRRTGRR